MSAADLSGAFTEKVGHLLKKTQGAPLFVETTGLADTGQVVAGVEQALAEHSDTGRLASVIVMVDAPRFLKLGAFWPAANDHLKRADTVILNKLDQIDDRQVAYSWKDGSDRPIPQRALSGRSMRMSRSIDC
ncbi:MAG: hypothetical protein KIT49_13910 [Nitrospira sp.]|nr:hypothetical protein [Nitrospira sp.]